MHLQLFTSQRLIRVALCWIMLCCSSFQGFSYQHQLLSNSYSLYLIEVDPKRYQIFPVHAYQQAIGRQSVEEMAKEHQALAAINGGFFKFEPFEGLPAGILKIENQWFGWPTKARGAIGWSNDGTHVLMDRILCAGFVKVLGKTFAINGINRPPQSDEIILFTPAFAATTLTSSSGFEIVVQKNQLLFVHEGGNHFIPPDGYVLSFSSKHALEFWKKLTARTPIELNMQVLPQLAPQKAMQWSLCSHLLGGSPLLIHQGEKITDFTSEQTLDSFLNRRYTRTAIGLLPNGHWLFVVVEGHQWSLYQGMTIPELAQLMANLGCYAALNLDGGGSSTMVVEGKIVNYPKGKRRSRLVSDAILIKARS